jgi:hypothetical protein
MQEMGTANSTDRHARLTGPFAKRPHSATTQPCWDA